MKIIINESKLLLLKEEVLNQVYLAKINEIANVVVKVMLAFKEGTDKYLKTEEAKNHKGINLYTFNNIILDKKTEIGQNEKIKKGFNAKVETIDLKNIDTTKLTRKEKNRLKLLSRKTAKPDAIKAFIRELIESGKLETKIEKQDKMVHPHPIDVTPWVDARRENPKFNFNVLYKCTITKKIDDVNGNNDAERDNAYYSVLNRDVDIFFIGKDEIPDITSQNINFQDKKLKVFFNTKTYNSKRLGTYVKTMLKEELIIISGKKKRMISNQNLPEPIKNIIEWFWLDKNRQAMASADMGANSFDGVDKAMKYWEEFKEFFQENNDPNIWGEVNDELKIVKQEESNDISKIKITFFQKTNEKFKDYIAQAHLIQSSNFINSNDNNPIAKMLLNGQEYSIDTQYGRLHFQINRKNKLIATIFMIDKNGEVQRVMNNHWVTVKDAADYDRISDYYELIKKEMIEDVIPSRMQNMTRPIQTEEDKQKLYQYKESRGIEQDKAWV